jgi:transcriptional regulator with XRE-family HTH domain
MEGFGKRLKECREEQRLTRRALAKLAGLHEQHLAKVERDERPHLEADTVVKLAVALDCTTDRLLGMPQKMKEGAG